MGARLAATLKKDSPENPLVRVKPGVFALREWDEKTIKSGLDAKKGKKLKDAAAAKGRGRDAQDGAEGFREPVAEADEEEVVPNGEEELAFQETADLGGVELGRAAMEVDRLEREPMGADAISAGATLPRGFVENVDDSESPAPDEAMRAEAA